MIQRAAPVGSFRGGPARLRTLQPFLLAALLVVLFAAAALNLACGLLLIGRPDEIRYGEAIIYEQAGRLLHGQALYQPFFDRAPYTVTAYTPLYYWLVAALRVLFGDGFGPGRALSFVAGLSSAALVGYLGWRRTRALWPAVAATALFVGLGLVGPIPWFAAYKEDVLGLALTLGAVAVLDGPPGWRRASLAALLAALAILTKQSMFGAALVGTTWLAFRQLRLAALFAGITLVAAGLPLAFLELTSHALLVNTVVANVNPFGAEPLVHNLELLALFQAGPLLVVAPVVWKRLHRREAPRDLLLATWLVSLVPLLGLGKEGADYNYWQLLAAATAVLAVCAVWDNRARARSLWSSAALGLNGLVVLAVVGGVVAVNPALIAPGQQASSAFKALLVEAHAAPHTVLADPLDASVLADRSIALEPVIYKLFYQTGAWDPAPLVSEICDGQVSLLVLGYPLETGPDNSHAAQEWPAPVLEALRGHLALRQVIPLGASERYVYAPDPARGCAEQSPHA